MTTWAVFRKDTGALVHTPSGTFPPDNPVSGFPWDAAYAMKVIDPADPAIMTWDTVSRTYQEDLAKLKVILITAVKKTNANFVSSLYTTEFGKQKKYSRKQAEVMDFRGLAPTTLSLNSALTVPLSNLLPQFVALGAAAQRKKFRFAMAEAAKRGMGVDAVITEWEGTIDSIEMKVADYEAIEQAAVRAINAATSPAAARAAAKVDWTWKST